MFRVTSCTERAMPELYKVILSYAAIACRAGQWDLPGLVLQVTSAQAGKSYTASRSCSQLSYLGAPADADRPEVAECIAARTKLQHTIAALELPANFLDELVHQLGGPGMGFQCPV